jgi:SAM-dependent methyltransferase
MPSTSWDRFFEEAVRDALRPGARVLDIGAGLRIDASRGNVEDPKRAWIKPLVAETEYLVMDPVATYHPDIVGDIHAIPIPEASFDSVFCLAVLEHVAKPWVAVSEMRRILKPNGLLVAYVPFLSPYHAMPGYYGDFFRFTEDGIRSLLADWTHVKITSVRGPVETLVHLLPGGMKVAPLTRLARWADRRRRSSGKQVSGYFFAARKPLSSFPS